MGFTLYTLQATRGGGPRESISGLIYNAEVARDDINIHAPDGLPRFTPATVTADADPPVGSGRLLIVSSTASQGSTATRIVHWNVRRITLR